MNQRHFAVADSARMIRAYVIFIWCVFASEPNASESPTQKEASSRGNCFNPLFKTHWAGKSDIRHLEAQPTLQTGLTRCQFYNGLDACCPAAFEEELQRSFDRWVQFLRKKIASVRAFQMRMVAMQTSGAFVKAGVEEQALFQKALESFGPVIESYGTCFNTLLEYVAGVLCFSCDPNWKRKVVADSDGLRVSSLRVAESTAVDLWMACEALGDASSVMTERVADSALTKTLPLRFEDLSMFSTKSETSGYMAVRALQVMRVPNEQEMTMDVGVKGRRLGREGEEYLYLVRDGRQSGLRCSVFPSKPLALSRGCRRCQASTARIGAMAAAVLTALADAF